MGKKELLLLSLLALGVTVPFLDKPFHIDDTFVLQVSRQILQAPLDPLGGEIDWFGHELSVWEATTNPPLVSYYLAPFAWISDFSESVLHGAMIPFYVLLAAATFLLARRFTGCPWWVTGFLMLSPCVVVSGNVMRDIPGVALATAAAAWFIRGVDDDRARAKAGGALLGGLAVLTKYSMGALLPVLALYPLLKGRSWRNALWLSLSAGVVSLWCLHTALAYGRIHPLYLFLERSSDSGIGWQDKFQGAFLILGSCLLLAPLLLGVALRARQWRYLAFAAAVTGLVAWHGWAFYRGTMDGEFYFWLVSGACLLAFTVWAGREDPVASDATFLVLWVAVTFFFSVKLVPFQAVRHLLLLLPPVLLLLFRFLEREAPGRLPVRLLTLLLVGQGGLALVVQAADMEYAATYRTFAESYKSASTGGTTWFVGHWGWMFYAQEAGWRQLHRDGATPQAGDYLIWPQKVHIGDVFDGREPFRKRLELISSTPFPARIPFRTMSIQARASFYATVRGRLPFHFENLVPLEVVNVYKVKPRGGKVTQEQ